MNKDELINFCEIFLQKQLGRPLKQLEQIDIIQYIDDYLISLNKDSKESEPEEKKCNCQERDIGILKDDKGKDYCSQCGLDIF